MKVSIERSDLLQAMNRAQGVVERRNTIPILANVLIEAEGEHVSFRATDLDMEIVDKAAAFESFQMVPKSNSKMRRNPGV